VSQFCIRTADTDLWASLDERVGQTWPDLLAGIGVRILETSPNLVVTSPLGRIEVLTPIPPPGGPSPLGPHTHFLPVFLATGREMPPGLEIPDAYAPCGIFYPDKPPAGHDCPGLNISTFSSFRSA
jgi:hypothetical protein